VSETRAIDLHVDLTGTRVRAGLENALRDAVRSGRLAAGTRLPSSRTLATDLGIARNTVADAYTQLVAEGWLVAKAGSGTRVGSRAAAVAAAESTSDGVAHRPAAPPGAHRPAAPPGAHRPGAPPGRIVPRFNLRPGVPDLAAFPRTAWVSATRRALAAAPYDALAYGDPRGRPELRVALAAYLARARGVVAQPERVVVVSGFTQGLDLLCEALAATGARTLALESFTLPGHAATARAHGLRTIALDIDAKGAVLQPADAAVLTPAHQFPLGPALAPERRTQAVESGALIVEDDYDGEFRYDRQPVGAMHALAPDRVVYAGTASKTLAPGLRLAWLVVPPFLLDPLIDAKLRADRNSSALDQLVLAEFIASGAYDRHIRRQRLAYRRRRDKLIAALKPHGAIRGVAAGLHALVELTEPEPHVVARAAERGLAVEGLDAYRIGPHPHPPALVVGYATPPEHAFTASLARLTATLERPDSLIRGQPAAPQSTRINDSGH
jgi:GntR family transcriptional regulator/MocR family aminotransferase